MDKEAQFNISLQIVIDLGKLKNIIQLLLRAFTNNLIKANTTNLIKDFNIYEMTYTTMVVLFTYLSPKYQINVSNKTITQVITNHGDFPAYYHRFNIKPVPQKWTFSGMIGIDDGLHFITCRDRQWYQENSLPQTQLHQWLQRDNKIIKTETKHLLSGTEGEKPI